MKKQSRQNIRHIGLRQRYQLKRRKWDKGTRQRKGGLQKNKYKERVQFANATAPENFNLEAGNVDAVIEYIAKVKKIGKEKNGVNFILTDVKNIGIGAISMLLSVMEELNDQNISFVGRKPIDNDVKNRLERSGFMNYVEGKVSEENKKIKNTIITTGDTQTHQSEIVKAIHDSMQTVWDENGRSPLLYGTIVEMIKNSCKHAFKAVENVKWHIAVNHDEDNKKVKFSFVDNGIGIIGSFEQAALIKKFAGLFRDNTDLINSAFQGRMKSKTGKPWRGTGLPEIYETFEDNVIKNLVVITNDVYCDFGTGTFKILKDKFSGTYYYWEIDETCSKHCFL